MTWFFVVAWVSAYAFFALGGAFERFGGRFGGGRKRERDVLTPARWLARMDRMPDVLPEPPLPRPSRRGQSDGAPLSPERGRAPADSPWPLRLVGIRRGVELLDAPTDTVLNMSVDSVLLDRSGVAWAAERSSETTFVDAVARLSCAIPFEAAPGVELTQLMRTLVAASAARMGPRASRVLVEKVASVRIYLESVPSEEGPKAGRVFSTDDGRFVVEVAWLPVVRAWESPARRPGRHLARVRSCPGRRDGML